MRTKTLAFLIFGLLLPGLLQASEYYTKHKGDDRRAEPTADKALVYVFRPATMGAGVKTWTFVDDEFVGVTRAKGYAFKHVTPGPRTVWAKAENTSGLDVQLEAGETYYFKTALRPGFGKARVKLQQIDLAEAEKYFKKCSFCEPTDEGRERAAEIAANRQERGESSAKKRKE